MGRRLFGALVATVVAYVCAAPAIAQTQELTTYAATGYRNGKRVNLELVQIGWAEVELKTARAFLLMREAAAADGISLDIRSGWRSYERQEWLYRLYRLGLGNQAARPGYSNHQAGRALDIYLDDDNATLAWLTQNGRRFGFQRTVRKEPWHWEFRGMPKQRAKARRSRRS
jgi:LAS superfamily LD-carboxypeptidase LdcB